MTSPTASLLDRLLTRSDLARLEITDRQVEDWIASRSLEPIGRFDTDQSTGEEVLAVHDATLRKELTARLAAAGRSSILMTPERIRSHLQQSRRGAADGEPESGATTATEALPAPGAAARNVTPAGGSTAHAPSPTDAAQGAAAGEVEWFDIGELEAAMGDLLPMVEEPHTESAAPSLAEHTGEGTGFVDVTEDLYALTEIVDGHREQLVQLAALPEVIEAMARRLDRLQEALHAMGIEPMPDDDAPAVEPEPTDQAPADADRRRTAALGIGFALLVWSGLTWFGTGSATLALLSVVAATVTLFVALRPPRDRR
jgi:hypothetical protein